MAVMVIISVMASVFIKKMNTIGETADLRAIDVGVSELNSREMLTWTNQKFAAGGYIINGADTGVFTTLESDVGVGRGYNLGSGYRWAEDDPDTGGGRLTFGGLGRFIQLNRSVSTNIKAARWSRVE